MNWEKLILELTYGDKMNVYRQTQVLDENTGILKANDEELVYSDVQCALSRMNNDIANTSINSQYKIFCSPELDIKVKDRIEIFHQGITYTTYSGVCFHYPSHIEIPIADIERI